MNNLFMMIFCLSYFASFTSNADFSYFKMFSKFSRNFDPEKKNFSLSKNHSVAVVAN